MRISVNKLRNTYIIKKENNSDFFVVTNNSIIIPTFNFFALIKFMLFRGLISVKSLEGLVEEYYSNVKSYE